MKNLQCKHGVVLYGSRCLNCEREKKQTKASDIERSKSIERAVTRAKNRNW